MEPLATVEDVIARWRPLSTSEQLVAETLIEDASDMIRVRWPDVDARLFVETLRKQTVVRIVAGMVRRALMNRDAEGVEQLSHSTGPFGQSTSFVNPNNNLYLTTDDITALDVVEAAPRVFMGWLV